MTQIIPLQAVPNQTFTAPLAGQTVDINLYQRTDGLFIDIFLNGSPIVLNVICQNDNRIIRNLYFGFPGDFFFHDSQVPIGGVATDPVYTGLDGRYQLIYIEASELPAGVG